MLDFRVRNKLPENFTETEYNLMYIKCLKDSLYSCKQFECGNISDSSDILLISFEESNENVYTLKGLFTLKKLLIL